MELLSDYQSIPFFLILIALFISSWTYYRRCWSPGHDDQHKHKTSIPTNWPVLGMLPAALQNYHRIHDYWTEVLFESGGTFDFKGPWFCNSDMVFTCDPENYHYILSKNFSNFPKGPEFQKIFDLLGEHGIFNSEFELWKIHREVNVSIMRLPDFQNTLQEMARKKLGQGLLPMLESFANNSMEVDLEDIFQRFTFDIFTLLLLHVDPGSLSIDLPSMPTHFAFLDVKKALIQRHVLPEWMWRFQKRVGFGLEKKYRDGMAVIDRYIYPWVEESLGSPSKKVSDQFNSLTAFINAYKAKSLSSNSTSFNSCTITKSFLRDVVLSLLVGGRDTTGTAISWLFFLLAKNPCIVAKILQEMKDHDLQWSQIIGNMNEYSPKLIYLHAAICETLRLYPPVALQHKAPVKPDVLPSGVGVNSNKKLVLFFYSTGRMESLWGKDCMEFKPERWITEQGKLRHEPSFKFPAFNAGPRTCLGRDITFVVVKMVAVSILCNYHVELIRGHPVVPSESIVIHMKHGLKVKLRKRSI